MDLLARHRRLPKRSVTLSIKLWLRVKLRGSGGKPPGIYYELTREGRRLTSEIHKRSSGRGPQALTHHQ